MAKNSDSMVNSLEAGQNSTNFHASQILLNRNQRAVRCPGFIGGRVNGGWASSQFQAGVGDCALFDFAHGFFAVADGSDRNSSASRQFMFMFSRMLKNDLRLPAERVHSISEISEIKKTLCAESEKLLCSLPFGTGCTFTGVLLLRAADGVTAIVLHTGDSLLIKCDLSASEACQFTVDNFWLVGRTQRFFQIEPLPVLKSTRLILATDGLGGISLPARTGREKFLLNLFESCSPDEIPDRLLSYAAPPSAGQDDMSVVSINPSAFTCSPHCLLLGGTSMHEEMSFQEQRARGELPDRYALIPSSPEVLTI